MKTGKSFWAAGLAGMMTVSSAWAGAKADLSLDDLGFGTHEMAADSVTQERLHKRSRMLKTHQILGLATAVPMTLTLMTASGVENGSASKRDLHRNVAMATGAMYFTTASFSIFAPEVDERPATGATKWHKRLAFIHFPAMVAAPILGYKAYKQKERGQEVHGVAKHHATVAGVGAAAYYLSMAIMVFNF